MHGNGTVSLGTLSGSWDSGVQVSPNGGCVYFNSSSTNDWHWVNMATPKVMKGKCWIVSSPKSKYVHNFFVTGDGHVWENGTYKASDSSQQSDAETIPDAGAALDEITGVWYTPTEDADTTSRLSRRRAGVSAQEVQKVIPEAVAADENGLLYVDYDMLTAFLIEAVKEQREEIRALRRALEENGLVKP